LLNVPELTPQQRYAEHQRFADSHTGGISPAAAAFNNDADPNRKLRIGYLSSDLRNHPTGVIMLPLLSGHDRENVEIFCYADVAQPDAMTARFQGAVDHWQSVTGRTDGQVAEMIRADGIDVLVSLCGHFDDNRPLVSAYRAAPVQVSLFDGSTSGLAEMDYWLTDGFLHPADTTEVFTEQLHRLPLLYQWSPIEGAPPVGPLPSDAAGHITFGSFNNPAKVNDAVINLWADALKAVPGSTLVLKYIDWYGQASLQGRIRAQFGALGIEKGRIALEASSDTFTEHLGWYGGIDIALDTFPFNGAATTFQALWMGVPVVSLVGDTFISRMSGSMLHPAGLGDLAVETPAAYVECARALAGDHGRLRDLRANLRGRISASALCDAVAYPRNVEAAYREMWQGWCAKTSD